VDPAYGMHLTGGSGSIKRSFMQYRELGARARAMLVGPLRHSGAWTPAQLRTENGMVLGAGGKSISYGELADAAMKQPVPAKVALKDPKDFRLIGKATARLDARAKSSGQQDFGIDVQLPGMLTAVVAHPPVFGAKIQVAGRQRPPRPSGRQGRAAHAHRPRRRRRGRGGPRLLGRQTGARRAQAGVGHLSRGEGRQRGPAGQLQGTGQKDRRREIPRRHGAAGQGAQKDQRRVHLPLPGACAHGAAELHRAAQRQRRRRPRALYLGTQMPGLDGMAAAKVLGLPPHNVKVHVQMAGGGFGRRAVPTADYVVEACTVAKAARAAGVQAPIRVLWSREDDIKGGYYRPMHVHRAEIGFDAKGQVLAWDHVIVGQSIVQGTPFEGMMIKDGIDATIVEGMREPYDVPMRLSVHHPKVNVPVLWWRSVGSTHTAYVMETLVDEIARATKQDPVAYRMKLMGDKHPRHKAALMLAVDQSGYGKRKLPKGQAWGVAVHESFDTVVAYVAEASVSKGVPKLHAVTAGVHCNLAVNPQTIEAQVQGAALMGLGTCLPGAAITLKDGVVEQSNFGDYVVARITDMPKPSPCTLCPAPSRPPAWASPACRPWPRPLPMPLPS
jgi:isoquinoline 1-oxidoreductase beta subunit